MREMIVDMVNAEAMVNVKVSFGTIIYELKDVSKSFKEAKMALDVGRIFYAGNRCDRIPCAGHWQADLSASGKSVQDFHSGDFRKRRDPGGD